MFEDQQFAGAVTGLQAAGANHCSLELLLDHPFHSRVNCGNQGSHCSRIRDTSRFLSRNLEYEE